MDVSINHKLVKSEDLNHHHTLYAGRCADWVVEAGFIAAARALGAEHAVCVEIHGMRFKKPVPLGQIVIFRSRPVLAGRTRLVVHVEAALMPVLPPAAPRTPPDASVIEPFVESFLTFVHLGEQGAPAPHGLVIEAHTEEEQALQLRAQSLSRQ